MAPSNVTTGPAEAALPAVENNISGTKPCLTSEHAIDTSGYRLVANAAAVTASADITTDAYIPRKASHAATTTAASAAASPSSVRRAAPMLTPAAPRRPGAHYGNAALQAATSGTAPGTTASSAAAATALTTAAANTPAAATGTPAIVSIALAPPTGPSAAATAAPLAAALSAPSTAFAARAAVCRGLPFSTEASVAAAAAPTVIVAEADPLTVPEVNQRWTGALATAALARAALPPATGGRDDMSTAAAKRESIQAEPPALMPPSTAPKFLVEELFRGSPLSGLKTLQASISHQRAGSTAAGHSGRPESPYVETTTRRCQETSANAAFSASAALGPDQLLVQHATRLLRCFASALMCVTQPTAAALSAAVEEEAVAGETATADELAQRPSHVPNLVSSTTPARHNSWQPCSDGLSSSYSTNSHCEAASACGAAAHSTDVVSPAALLYLVAPLPSQETERSFEHSIHSTEAEAPSQQQQQQRQQHYQESQHQGLSSQQGQQQQQQELEKQQQKQRQERLLRRAVAAAVELRRLLLLLCAALPRGSVVRGLNQGEETGCALSVGDADAEGETDMSFNSPDVCSCTPTQLLQPPRHCRQHHWAPQQELEKDLLIYPQERRRGHERRRHHATASDSPGSPTKVKCRKQETRFCSQGRRLSLEHLRQQQLRQKQLRQQQLRQQQQQQLKTQMARDGRKEEALCSRERSLRKHSTRGRRRRRSKSSISRSSSVSSSVISSEHSAPSATGDCISECARRPVVRSMPTYTRPKRWSSPAVLPADAAATGAAEGEAEAGHTEIQRERAGSEPARRRRRRAQEDFSTRTSKLLELRLRRSRLLRRFQRQRYRQQTLLQQLGRIFLFCSTVRSSPTLFSAYLLLLLCTPGNAGDMLLLSLAGFWKVCDDAEAAAAAADAAVCAAAADVVTTPASHSTSLVKSTTSPFDSSATAATAPDAVASCKPTAVARGGRQPGIDSAPVEKEEETEERDCAVETERQKRQHYRDRILTAGTAHAAGDVSAGSPRACCCCRWHLLRRIQCVEYVRCFVAELLPLLLWMYTSRCLLPPHKLCLMHSSLLVLPHIDVAAAASAAVSSAAAVTTGTPGKTAAVAAPALGVRPLASRAQQCCAALAKGVCQYLQGVIEDPRFVEEAPDSYVGLENLLLLLAGERCTLLAVAGVAAAGLAAAATGSTTSSAAGGQSGQAAVETIVASLQQLTHEQELALALRAAEMASFAGEAIISAGAAAAAAPPHTLVAAAASDVNSSACRRLLELLDATFAGPSYVSKGVSELRRADSAAVARTIAAQHADAEILLRMLMGSRNCIHPEGLHNMTEMQARSPIFRTEQSEAHAERSESRRAAVNENFLGRRIAAAARKKEATGGKYWVHMLCGESLLIRRSVGFPLTRMTAQQQQQLTLRCLCTCSFYAGVCAALEKHIMEQCVVGGTAAMACCCGNVPTLINGGSYYVLDCKTNTGHSNTDTCCCSKSSDRHSDVWPSHTHSNRSIGVSRETLPYTSNSAGCMTPSWDRRGTRRRRDGRKGRGSSYVVASSTVNSGVSVLPGEEAKEHACSVAAAGAGWRPGAVAAALAAAAEGGEEQALLPPQEHLEMLTAWYLAAVTNAKALTPVSLRHVLPQPLINAMLREDGEQQRLKKCSKHLGVSQVVNSVCACKACTDAREIVAAAQTTSGCRQPLGSTGGSRPDAAAAQGLKSLQDVRAIVAAALSEKTPSAGGGMFGICQQKMHSLYTLEQLLNMSVDPWGAGNRPPPAAVSEGLLLQAAATVGRLLFLRQRICITPCLLDSDGNGGSRSRRSSNSMVSSSSSSGFFENRSNQFKDAGLLRVLADVQGRELERIGLIWRRLAQEQLQRQQHRLHMQHIREAPLHMWQGNHKQHYEQQAASLEKESSISMPQQHIFSTVADSHARQQLDSHCKDPVQQKRKQNCIGAKWRVLPELSESSTPRFQSALSLVQPQHAGQQPNMLLPPEAAHLLHQSTHAPQRYRVILPQQQVLRLLLWHQMEHFDCSCEHATSANGLNCTFLTGLAACCCVDGLDACMHLCGEERIRLPLSGQEVPMQHQEKELVQQQQWCACGTSTCSGTHTVEALSQGAAAAARVWGDAWLRQRLVRHELERALAAIEKRAARDMLLKSYWAAAAIRNVLH